MVHKLRMLQSVKNSCTQRISHHLLALGSNYQNPAECRDQKSHFLGTFSSLYPGRIM